MPNGPLSPPCVPHRKDAMAKAKCVQNVTFGATGEVYESGKVYDVPAATLKRYGEYFEKMAAKPQNKAKTTEENK